jgi:alpha-amylase
MADLDHAGLTGISPLNSVTFVENHDTDLSSTDKIVTNKLLGYAYILTSEGYPCVYYRDYSTDKDCLGLKPKIDNLIWIHEVLAAGTTEQRWKNFDVFAYERTGGARLLVALNNDPDGPHTIHVATGFGAGVALHDYSGHGPNVITDGTGSVTLTVPPNINGLGYICYSRDGQGGSFNPTRHAVKQDFEGATDLDILPALNGTPVSAGRIWCDANSPIQAILKPDTAGWTASSKIELALLSPDGSILANENVASNTPAGTSLHATARATGFHTIQLTASNMPVANLNPSFEVSVTYTATQTL